MFSETRSIFMLFETNLVCMLFALMLFGNSPKNTWIHCAAVTAKYLLKNH